MLTVEQVEEILNEIVGPDQRVVSVHFPNVHVQTQHPGRYGKHSGQILTTMIEVSGTKGPMTFGYGDTVAIEPPEAGVREPRRPTPPGPPNSAKLTGPTT